VFFVFQFRVHMHFEGCMTVRSSLNVESGGCNVSAGTAAE